MTGGWGGGGGGGNVLPALGALVAKGGRFLAQGVGGRQLLSGLRRAAPASAPRIEIYALLGKIANCQIRKFRRIPKCR
jgi:hypothetical protein